MFLLCLTIMMVASINVKAQDVTITLHPGCTWISYPKSEVMDIPSALGDFVPMEGDVIKSQYGYAFYSNGQWRGLQDFTPGWGYMYFSNRTEDAELVFTQASFYSVTTAEPTDITATSAVVGGMVNAPEGTHVFLCGVCWDTEPNPNIDGNHTSEETGIGSFTSTLEGLSPRTIYYVRAYATNLQGTAYGNEVTLDFSQVLPVVTTQAVSGIDDIDTTTATFNGMVENIGDPAYTERGFIYGTMQVPTLDEDGVLTVSASGTGTGAYARTVSGLETGTTYYVRAYAKVGTLMVYGNIVSFVAELPPYVILSNGLNVATEDAGMEIWNTAITICNNSSLAGFTDWRLPTKQELLLVYDNRNLIGNFKSSWYYWSSTPHETYSNSAYYVDFSNNGKVGIQGKSYSGYVRCVRTAE